MNMPANPVRYGAPDPAEPIEHELPTASVAGDEIMLRLRVRRAEDGTWRARLIFGAGDSETSASTAEIFCAESENDLWQAVRDLRDHHIRDLYRSIVE
jgi:hypothetical protein